jgi:GNAT superfamily N-acetyltransferase
MSDGFLVREVERSDFDRWLPLWNGYNAFYGRAGPTALPSDITEATWERFFDPGEPMYALVAEAGDEIIGLAHSLFHRSTTSLGPICYLQDLFTSEAARGKGVATALVERVCDAAKQAGAARVYWQTHETNESARRLYDRIAERSGFIVYQITI